MSNELAQMQYVVNSIGMKMAVIPAGELMLGAPEDEPFFQSPEKLTPATIAEPFLIAIYETTQRQYFDVTGDRPSRYSRDFVGEPRNRPAQRITKNTDDYPVEELRLLEIFSFCNC